MEKELIEMAANVAATPSPSGIAGIVSAVIVAIITIAFSLHRIVKEYKDSRATDVHNDGIISKLEDMYKTERQARLDAEARADNLTRERDESVRSLLVVQREMAGIQGKLDLLEQQMRDLKLALELCQNANN